MSIMLTLFFEDPERGPDKPCASITPKVTAKFSSVNKNFQQHILNYARPYDRGVWIVDDDLGETVIHKDNYGSPLTYVSAGDLSATIEHCRIKVSMLDESLHCFIKALPKESRVILYWQ